MTARRARPPTGIFELRLSPAGWLTLPPGLAKAAGLRRSCVLAGVGSRIELYNNSAHKRERRRIAKGLWRMRYVLRDLMARVDERGRSAR